MTSREGKSDLTKIKQSELDIHSEFFNYEWNLKGIKPVKMRKYIVRYNIF